MLIAFLVFSLAIFVLFFVSLLWSPQRWMRMSAGLVLLFGGAIFAGGLATFRLAPSSSVEPAEMAFPRGDEALANLREASGEVFAEEQEAQGAREQIARLRREAVAIEAQRRRLEELISREQDVQSLSPLPPRLPTASERAELDRLSREMQDLRAEADVLRAAASSPDLTAEALAADAFFEGKAEVAHSAPSRMAYQEEYAVRLVLAPETSGDSAEDLFASAAQGPIVTQPGVDYAIRMQATLEGSAFEVSPSGPQVRRIPGERPVVWDWTVKPTQFGHGRQLTFRLEAIHREGNQNEVIATETYRAVVFVDVGWIDWMRVKIEEVGPLSAAFGGLVTLLIAVGGFYFQYLRRKSKPPPTEVIIVNPRDGNTRQG